MCEAEGWKKRTRRISWQSIASRAVERRSVVEVLVDGGGGSLAALLEVSFGGRVRV